MDLGYIVRVLPAMALAQDPVFGGNIRTISINGTRNMVVQVFFKPSGLTLPPTLIIEQNSSPPLEVKVPSNVQAQA